MKIESNIIMNIRNIHHYAAWKEIVDNINYNNSSLNENYIMYGTMETYLSDIDEGIVSQIIGE